MTVDEAQIRLGESPEADTGECEVTDIAEGLRQLTSGRAWKLSFTTRHGRRYRLVKDAPGMIEVTFWDEVKLEYVRSKV